MIMVALLVVVSAAVIFTNAELSEADTSSYSGNCGDDIKYIFDESSGTLSISGSGKMYNYYYNLTPWDSFKDSIKSVEIMGSVTTLGDHAFQGCSSITSVALPDSVKSIGPAAFRDCTSLVTINLPDSLTYIGTSSFYNCTSLISVTIPESVTSIENTAFYGCTSLISISFPSSLTMVGKSVFSGKIYGVNGETELAMTVENLAGSTFDEIHGKWIKKVSIPSEESSYKAFGVCGKDLIYEFDALAGTLKISGSGSMFDYLDYTMPWYLYYGGIETVIITDGVTSIGDYAFLQCTSMTSVTLPDSLRSIGDYAFMECRSLPSIALPGSVTTIGSYSFYGCTGLTSVTLSDSVTTLGKYAFYNCSAISTLVLGKSVTSLGESAFGDCTGLNELTIPAGLDCVVSIDSPVFEGCSNIEKITFIGWGNWYTYGVDPFQPFYKYAPWQISKSTLNTIVVSEGLTSIGHWAFYDCVALTSVTLSDTVTIIEDNAFCGCNKLTSITIPDSVISIKDSAFKGCTNLSSLTIGNSVRSFGTSVFENCSSLTSITIPDYVTSIKDSAFKGCTNLSSLTIGNSVRSFGTSVFENCSSLTSITIPDYVTSIKDSAFKGCTNLSSLTIGNSVTTLGSSAFENCTSLTSVTLPDSVKTLENSVFSGCYSLVTINIPCHVATIGDSAFHDCSSLASISLPISVTSFGGSPFDGKFYDPDGKKELGSTVEDLDGYTFINKNGKWIQQMPSDSKDLTNCSGMCGPNATYNIYSNGTLKIAGSGEMYQYNATDAPWYGYRGHINKIVIGDNITKLGSSAFVGMLVTEVTLPITLNSVGSDKCPAFVGCEYIETINFTSGAGGYGYNYAAYKGCDSWYQNTPWYQSRDTLKEINFANGVNAIGSDAFRELYITSITLPDSVVHLGNHCFFNCTKLTDLTIPVSLNPYGSDDKYPAFRGCMAVQKVTFTKGNGVPFDYYNWAGSAGNTDLAPWNMNSDIAKTIIITDDVGSLGQYMFLHCNIKELTIPISANIHLAFDAPYNNLEKVTISKGAGKGYDIHTIFECPLNAPLNLESVTIEEGVTSIGVHLFRYCNIENLVLPNSLVFLEKNSFYRCNIKNLTIPISLDAVCANSNYPTFGPAFEGVSGLEKIDFIPGSGKGFDYSADKGSNCWYQQTPWYLCRATLNKINFSEGITYIGSNAFCEQHLTSLVLPNSLESLGQHAFYNMESLFSLTLPATLDSVGSTKYPAFEGCVNINNMMFTGTGNWFEYSYSDSEPSYYGYTPWQFSKIALDSVEISRGVTSVGKLAFEDCTHLANVDLGRSIESLGDHVFKGCTSLTSITIPTSVRSIGEKGLGLTFYDTDGETQLDQTVENLADSTFNHIDGKWLKQDPSEKSGKCGRNIAYKLDLITGTLTIDGFGQIESYSSGDAPWFPYRDLIRSIIISDNVTSIGASAFEGCTSLTFVSLPNSIISIEDSAFKGCSSLSSLNIPISVTSLGECAFMHCTSLKRIILPPFLASIGNNAFMYCTSLTSISVPDSVTEIGSSVFFNCTSLTSVTLSESLRSIGDFAFSNCTSLTSLEFPGSLTVIGDSSFHGCNALTSISFSDSVESIGNFAFEGCTALSSLTISDSVKTIGSCAFYGCTSLSSLTLGSSITTIGDNAFEGKFYSLDGKTELEPTHANLAKFAFNNIDGKWIKQNIFGKYRDGLTYEFNFFTGTLAINGSGQVRFYSSDAAPWNTYKDSITSIIIGDKVTFVGDFAFEGYTHLASISFGRSVDSIEFSAFKDCPSLASFEVSVENMTYSSADGVLFNYDKTTLIRYPIAKADASYEVPASVTSISSCAFKDCTFLESLIIPGSITSIGSLAFDVTFYDIGGEIELLQNVENLAGSTFNNVDGKWIKQDPLKKTGKCGENFTYELNLYTGTLTINGSGDMGSYSSGGAPWFLYKDSITSIVVGDDVTSIGDFTFEGCTSLTTIHFGRSVGSFGTHTFKDCSSLASFEVSAENTVYTSTDGVLFNNDKTVLIQYPLAKADASYEVPASVTSISSSAFKDCTFLTSITIPDSVTTIGYLAFDVTFYDTEGEIELEQTVENLAGYVFYNVSGKWIKQKEFAKCGDDATYEFDFSTGTLTIKGSGAMDPYSIRASPWYSHRDSITSIIIGDKVTSIGDFAFEGCTSLATVTIPDSITSIGRYAFYGCSNLVSVTLPDSITAISDSMFGGCSSLDSVIIPNNVRVIGEYAFNECTKLASVTISDSVRSIGSNAFYNCTSLQLVNLPDSVTFIGKSAFYGCFSLTSMIIPDSVTELASNVFTKCSSLSSVTIGNSVSTIGDKAFRSCTGLTSITFGDSVKSIGNMAFYGCSALTTITLSDSVSTIGDYAFNGCTSLTSISIPLSVTNIGNNAFNVIFYDADGEIELEQTVENLAGYMFNNVSGKWIKQVEYGKCGENVTYKLDLVTGTLFINGSGAMDSYLIRETPWYPYRESITSIVISDEVTFIGDFAFEGCSITSVTIPDSVTSTGRYVFYWCTDLVSVTLPDSITAISDSLFSGCSSLESVLIPNTVTSIGEYSFYECTKLTSITIPDSVGSIGTNAFYNCTSLQSVTIPESVTFIDNAAFCGCSSLTSVILPDSITELAPKIFSKCSSLSSVTLGNSVHSIGYDAFSSCTELASITLGDSVEYIAYMAFCGCSALTTIAIPDSVTFIGDYAFYGCPLFTSITIPDSVTFLGNNTFNGTFYKADGETELESTVANLAGSTFNKVDGKWIKQNKFGMCGESANYDLDFSTGTLTINGSGSMYDYSDGISPWYSSKESISSIVIGDSITSIGAFAFGDCTALTSLTIPNSITSVGDYAFEGVTTIESITIPDSVETIGYSAFEGCTKLATVNLGRSVNFINDFAFEGCSSLVSFVVSDENSAYCSVDGVLFNSDKTTLVQYPLAKADTSYRIPDTVTTIRSSAFNEWKFLTSLTIPDSVETIEDGAFDITFFDTDGEKELEDTVEDLVGFTFNKVDGKWIKQKEFGKCGRDVTFEFDSSTGTLTLSGSGPMYSKGIAPWYYFNDTITSVVIGDSITTLAANAFDGCTALTSITIPASISYLGDSAFNGTFYKADGETEIEPTVANLAGFTFNKVDGKWIKEVSSAPDEESTVVSGICGKGVTFEFDTSTGTLTLSGSGSMFSNGIAPWYYFKDAITSVVIGDSVTYIGENAFDGSFYLADGETELEPTAANLAGSTFNNVDGKWIKIKN